MASLALPGSFLDVNKTCHGRYAARNSIIVSNFSSLSPSFSKLHYIRSNSWQKFTLLGVTAEPLMFSKESGRPGMPFQVNGDTSFANLLNANQLRRFPAAHGQNDTRLRIFSGTANPALSQEIASNMGLELGKIMIKRFADGEIYVQLQESVRGCDVYLVQPTCPPANENLMELLIMIDACRRASAKNITAVVPHLGTPADRKGLLATVASAKQSRPGRTESTQGRESIAAKLVANLITEAGADRVLACDLHSGQSMGYFDIPVDHVPGQPVILDYLASKTICSDDLVVVSPDVGGVARARAFAKKLSDAPLAIVDKRRVMNLIGDVRGKVAVMVDDMIDTAGYCSLHQEGAREVYACTTHGFSGCLWIVSGGNHHKYHPCCRTELFPPVDHLICGKPLGRNHLACPR
ncbi:hypothetical protein R3W88_026892 [Solanum pinnatisectum]|uniref:ribose-phosphate diphosphokinase n=1 Tax=Solanum pinnatisectum TaxID=50273 RepID=A0AAV9LF69_9SOLN|nr:hypothetical protein R3W88_026892 [Solanum pinnatisectum]